MSTINWFYSETRAQRSRWICERFQKELISANTILDVGCSQSALKHYLPPTIQYYGIDISGEPDSKIDLDKVRSLPFEDNKFEAVICADVLEHLENVHLIFDELCRVASQSLIVTLPNPVYGLYRYLLKRKYQNKSDKPYFGNYMKYYGLPVEKPVDRHRWFYGYDEAVKFITYRTRKNGLMVKSIENNLMFERKMGWKKVVLYLLKAFNSNMVYRDIIFLITKKNS